MLRSTIMAHMQEALTDSKFRFKQLQEINNEIPWDSLVELVKPHYLESNLNKELVPIDKMLRVYFLQLRYGMSPSGVEEALFQIEALREFADINIDTDVIPSDTSIIRFNDLIESKALKQQIKQSFDIQPVSPQQDTKES